MQETEETDARSVRDKCHNMGSYAHTLLLVCVLLAVSQEELLVITQVKTFSDASLKGWCHMMQHDCHLSRQRPRTH